MLALSFHLFLYFYCRRKFWLYNQQWYTVLTYWYIGLYFMFILLYWTGDFEYFTFKLIYKNLILSIIIIYLTFSAFNVFWIVKDGAVFWFNTLEYMDIYAQNTIYKYFYYLKNDLNKNYFNFLNNEWYKYQLNYNKYFKSLFIIFLNLFSLIIALIQISLYYYYFFFFFFFIHFPLTFIYIIVEYNKFKITFYFLFFIFIYNLIISIFLPNTKGIWIFFFYKYHFKWRHIDTVYFIDQDVLFFHDIDYLYRILIVNSFYQCKEHMGHKKKNYKDNNWVIIFNDDFLNDRFWIPAPWRSLKYSEISCFVNSFSFKLWMHKLNLILYIVFPYQFINYTVITQRYFVGFGNEIIETISYKRRRAADFSVKKYKFK